jgi:hypothetical protein
MRIGNGILVMIEEGKKERKEEGAGDALRPWLLFYLYSSIAFSHLGSLPFLPSLLRRERERAGRCFLLLLRRSYLEGAILGVWTCLYLFFSLGADWFIYLRGFGVGGLFNTCIFCSLSRASIGKRLRRFLEGQRMDRRGWMDHDGTKSEIRETERQSDIVGYEEERRHDYTRQPRDRCAEYYLSLQSSSSSSSLKNVHHPIQ